MIIGSSNFGVREVNGKIFFKGDNGGINSIKRMNGSDVRQMKKALRSMQYFDLKGGIRRNEKPIPKDASAFMLERKFVAMFEPVEAYLENTGKKQDDVIMTAYMASFGQGAFDMKAYYYFKEMFMQMVDIYKDVIR